MERELLDTDEKKVNVELVDPWKVLNTVLLILPFMIILFTIWRVWYSKGNLSSPWLPEYTTYFINAALINFAIIQSIAILPAFFLRFTKKYILSSSCIILFFISAIILKHSVSFYWDVFRIMN